MNEIILVEFIAGIPVESDLLLKKLSAMSGPELYMKKSENFSTIDGDEYTEWMMVTCEISSTYASVIKLQDSFLAERMRISYIPKELKDKYRR